MDEKEAKKLWEYSKSILFLLLVVDFGVILRILTIPMGIGWLIFWVVALTVTCLANLVSTLVFLVKPFGRGLGWLEILAAVVTWFLGSAWMAWGSFSILELIPGIAPSLVYIGASTLMILYFLVRMLCYAVPGNNK